MLSLDVINDLAEELVDDLLGGEGSLVEGELLGVFEVGLIVAQVETSNHVIEWIFGLRGKYKSIDTINDMPKGQSRTIVPIEH